MQVLDGRLLLKTGSAGLIVLLPFLLFDAVEGGLLFSLGTERSLDLDLGGLQVDTSSEIDQFIALALCFFSLLLLGGHVTCRVEPSLADIDVVDFGVVKGLVGVLVLEAEPGLVVRTLLYLFVASIEGPDRQEEHMPLALKVFEFKLDLSIVIYLQLLISEVIQESQTT